MSVKTAELWLHRWRIKHHVKEPRVHNADTTGFVVRLLNHIIKERAHDQRS